MKHELSTSIQEWENFFLLGVYQAGLMGDNNTSYLHHFLPKLQDEIYLGGEGGDMVLLSYALAPMRKDETPSRTESSCPAW